MLTAQKIPGRGAKGMKKADRIQLLLHPHGDVSYEQLLRRTTKARFQIITAR